jgi:drug/metabolite transporter (DMT)-like permease
VADEKPDLSDEQVERATNLLDIRRIIGSLLAIYGVLLIGAGVFGSHTVKNKAAGVNIDLWVGAALILASGLFWFWAITRSLVDELEDEDDEITGAEQPALAEP